MVFFDDPVPLASHELHAAQLALAMRERSGRLRRSGRSAGMTSHSELVSPPVTRQRGASASEGRYDYDVDVLSDGQQPRLAFGTMYEGG
jgi:hypothetical protein